MGSEDPFVFPKVFENLDLRWLRSQRFDAFTALHHVGRHLANLRLAQASPAQILAELVSAAPARGINRFVQRNRSVASRTVIGRS